MKKIIVFVVSIGIFSAAHAQEAFKPPVVAPVQGAHCNAGMGPVPLMAYDANGHLLQCASTSTNGEQSWEYVAERDLDRITRRLDQLNATNAQILVALTQLVAAQYANVQKQ
ncbi:hypothetical protein [Burkholderia sp. Tr-20390]|uniref:hypothetical protein n=1 Tax=Burkholderia sp. Tr-20390 TaxID=2703904 RepID=UPI00198254DF|nr:hypothetical protein [Burkholderia sp. Tr-20390]MBN3729414.1 hypothetical protein [Burkholderia sp. Tr-20390]